MSGPSWLGALRQTLGHVRPRNHLPRIAVVGIGHELRGDDGVGLAVIRDLRDGTPDSPQLLIVDAGPAPENVTGVLRRFGPDLVILVDAVQMNVPAATVTWVPWEEATGFSASTHTLPLALLGHYLTVELRCAVYLLGIQPARDLIGAPVSPEVQASIREVVSGLGALLLPAVQVRPVRQGARVRRTRS